MRAIDTDVLVVGGGMGGKPEGGGIGGKPDGGAAG